MRRHQIDGGLLAIELLPDDHRAMWPGEDIGSRRTPVRPANWQWIRKRPAPVSRAGIKQTFANLAVGVPRDVIGARGRDRETWPVMWTGRYLPVVLADAADLAGRRRIGKGHDR